MNSISRPIAAGAVTPADIPAMEREIALMERAIALHDRHAELKRQMEARGLALMDAALFMPEIAELVAGKHGVEVADLIGRSRLKRVAAARLEAMWVMNERRRDNGQRRWSNGQIADFFNRDRTTVISNVRSHAARLERAA